MLLWLHSNVGEVVHFLVLFFDTPVKYTFCLSKTDLNMKLIKPQSFYDAIVKVVRQSDKRARYNQ